ncbi:DUF58 domain-containing protein [Granulosicoccus sp. 3-233]|uniref:DUF58 domain-containing protein n=1 Tax=Granulosicoccus sp. 3-233 TaxID=3417969 RepID=UPI003D33084F
MSLPDSDKSADSAITLSIDSLLNERHAVHQGTLQQPEGGGRWAGSFRGRRRGHGSDFDDLRPYSPGDELRHVDWKASARSNTLYTRLYREEREHRVTLVTDMRRTMYTGTTILRSVQACRFTARLLWQSIESGSRLCVIAVSDSGLTVSDNRIGDGAAIDACALLARRFLALQAQYRRAKSCDNAAPTPAGSDLPISGGHAQRHGQATTTAEPPSRPSRPESSPDALISPGSSDQHETGSHITLDQVARWLCTQRQLHGSLIWLSAFDHLGKHFDDAMNTLSRVNRQAAVHMDDGMLEQGLPTGLYGYRSGDWHDRRTRSATLDRGHAKQLQQRLSQQKQRRMERFTALRIPLHHSGTGKNEIVAALRHSGHLP